LILVNDVSINVLVFVFELHTWNW